MPLPADEWQVDRLDLDAYLRRISWSQPVRPDAPTLAALHRAHLTAIGFENLDVMLGRGISVELDAIQAKLVGQRRGGYCYEHGLLFGAALTRLGYQVDRYLGRVGDPHEHIGPRSHLVLVVRAGGEPWLADTGFGSGLLEPVPLAAGGPHRQGDWTFQVARDPDSLWLLQEHQQGEWATAYSFRQDQQHWVDVDTANYVTANRPSSPFTQRPILVRKDDHRVQRLVGREFSVSYPDHAEPRRHLDDAAFAAALPQVFGLTLTGEEITALTATLPPAGAPRPSEAAVG